MEVEGKIIESLPLQSGVGKSSGREWKKKQYVLETMGESFPRKIFFGFFGDRVDQYPLNVGDTIRLHFDIESRQYQDRWYTDINGWKVEHLNAPAGQPGAVPSYPGEVPPPSAMGGMPVVEPSGNGEDLPF